MGDLSHEQSMEEILSSIKRIIAEDSEANLSPPRPRRAVGGATSSASVTPVVVPPSEPDVLELTDAVPAESPSMEPEPEIEAIASPRPKPQPRPEPSPPPVPAPQPVAALVSDDALTASRSAIAALSALVVKPEVTGVDTLEGLVREMLKPMLTEWLDARLPDIVERLVAQEIRRITERGA